MKTIKKCLFDGFKFKRNNEYFYNSNTQSLNYNVSFPQLSKNIIETKIHCYATWSQKSKISDLIEVSSNAITSINNKISPIFLHDEISNYGQETSNIFTLVDAFTSSKVFSKSIFISIAKLLKLESNHIELLSSLLLDVKMNTLTNNLILITTDKYSLNDKYFLEFIIGIICNFINQNSFNFIDNIVFNNSKY